MVKRKAQEKDLLGLSALRETVETVLFTPYIKNEKPVSLLIVAKPESGKTAVLKSYVQNKGIVYITDCTAYGLSRDILPKISSGEVRTIIIPDLITPLSKSHKTRQSFIAFLNNLIEEGVVKVSTYVTVWEKEARANVITAVTDEELRDGRHDWAKMGFLSRFLIFSYSYPISLVTQIFRYYTENHYIVTERRLNLPENDVDVVLPAEIAQRLDPIAIAIGQAMQTYGIRAKINLRSFIKALALKEGRKKVTEKDFERLIYLANWLNLNFNPVGVD